MTEQQPIPAINRNLSWLELSEQYKPFEYRIDYWLDFFSSRDPDQIILIDRLHPGALRHKTPQMILDRKIEALKACNPSNLDKQVVIIAGIELPSFLLQRVPEAKEASKYFILSKANRSRVGEYHSLRDAFRKNEKDREFREYMNLIVEVMPESRTRSFLSDLVKNGNFS